MGDYLILGADGKPVGGLVKITPQEIYVNQETVVDFIPTTSSQIVDFVVDGCGVHEEFQVNSGHAPFKGSVALKPTKTGIITVDMHQTWWVVGDAKGEIKVTREVSGPLGIWKFPVLNRVFKWFTARR